MLKIPQLDNLSFDKLFERARSRIPGLMEEWTDFNHHDPGITTLQAYAWLVDTLNYYINATGEEHRLKYLKLLGLLPEKAAARCNLSFSAPDGEEILVPKGTRIAAGEVVFELEETFRGRSNRMISLFNEVSGSFYNLTPFAGVDGSFAQLFTWDKEKDAAVYFGFVAPLEGTVRPWVEVAEDTPRNPFGEGFSLAELVWEYFDGSRWRAATLERDETCGFLRSGFITLALETPTGEINNPILPSGHYLRCTLVKNEYDMLPRIGRVALCCAEAVQHHTHVQALNLTYTGNPEIPLDYCFRENDQILVVVEEPDGLLRLWYENSPDNTSLCEILPGEHAWQKVLRFNAERFGREPEPGRQVLVVVAAAAAWENIFAGRTSGCAEDRLSFDIENLYNLRLALVDPRESCLRLWALCEDIRQASFNEAVFAYHEKEQEIVFGNGLNGMQPDGGQLVMAVTLQTSLLEGGHVRKGQVNRFLDPMQPGLQVQNLEDAAGGKTPKTSQELQEYIQEKLEQVTRAVNAEDYKALVMRTPGLIIDLVNVIPMKEYARAYNARSRPNTVLLAVKPYSAREPRPVLTENYRRRIQEYLERYRLLTTNIVVIPPRYAGIVVHGQISMAENTAQNRELLHQRLREMIDFTHSRHFGGKVVYGNIFSRLELMECVRRVEQLSFEYVGGGARSNEQGDIILHPDTLAYILGIDIEFN